MDERNGFANGTTNINGEVNNTGGYQDQESAAAAETPQQAAPSAGVGQPQENGAYAGAGIPPAGTPASAPQAEPAPVDYSVGAGARETVGRAPAAAFDSSDSARAEAAAAAAAGQATYESAAEGGGAGNIPPDGSSAGTGGYMGEYKVMQQPPKKKRKLSAKAKKIIACVLLVCICAGAGFGGGALAVSTFSNSSGGGSSQTIKIDASDAESLNAASAIAKKVMPSVVGISTVSQTYTQTIFGLQQGTQEGVGTGIIVTSDGYILTNSHVVNDGKSESITVDLYDGTEYTGTVLWNSEDLDLAIVKIDATGLTAAELGDSDDVEIGDYAVAIGNPLGLNFERSVTQGIISGLDRTITATDSSTGSENTMEGLIQTDASINSGNSGGPLINSSGQVIGINSAKASSAEGLGFAIPINTATPIIEEIKENGTYEQSYIGISGMNVEVVKAQYQTDFNAETGVYIIQIYTNSPASEAGLQEGDIITALNGTEVEDMSALKKELVKYRPGDTVTITYERDKQTNTVQLTLAAESSSTQKSLTPSTQSSDGTSGSSGSSGSSPYNYFYNYFN